MPTLAPPCKPYRQRRPARLRVPRSTPDSQPRSKSDHVVITWSPSGYTPVVPYYPDVLSSPYLLITTWQIVKAHRVTSNEPKIHVICYITQVVHHCSSTDTDTAKKGNRSTLSEWLDLFMIDSLWIAVQSFIRRRLSSLSLDETLPLRYLNWSNDFRCLKHMNSDLFVLTQRPIPLAARTRLCIWDSAWEGIFTRSIRSSA